jgi:hypothetical protein
MPRLVPVKSGTVPAVSDTMVVPRPGTSARSDPFAALAADLRDRYVLERELGRGGMAIVFLAHDLKHDRPVLGRCAQDGTGGRAASARQPQSDARDRNT